MHPPFKRPPPTLTETAEPWRLEREWPRQLEQDLECDLLVIGGGVSGLAIAQALAPSRQITLIDARRIGEGMTGWAAGVLSDSTTIDLRDVEAMAGTEGARALIDALGAILETWQRRLTAQLPANARPTYLPPDLDPVEAALPVTSPLRAPYSQVWQQGKALYVATSRRHLAVLEDERSLRERYGQPARLLAAAGLEGWRGLEGALELPGQHGVNPMALLEHLARDLVDRGGSLFEETAIRDVAHTGGRFVATTMDGKRIEARDVVLCPGLGAAHFPQTRAIARLMVPVVSHVALTAPSRELERLCADTGVIALWDTLQLYHYLRYLPDGRLLIGGEDRAGRVPGGALEIWNTHIRRLHRWARAHHATPLPPVERAWRATLAVPADGLPVLEYQRFGENTLVTAVTDGLPSALVMGKLVAQRLGGGEASPLDRLFAPSRPLPFPIRALRALPLGGPLRALAHTLAFAGLRLRDALRL